jgi:hypothetical protein
LARLAQTSEDVAAVSDVERKLVYEFFQELLRKLTIKLRLVSCIVDSQECVLLCSGQAKSEQEC